MPEYYAVPRPPWMWNTPYLQELYRSNQAYYDNLWNTFVEQNPQYANFGRSNQLLPSGGSPSYSPPSQQNWPGGNVPINYDLNYTPGMPSYSEYGQGGGQQGGNSWADTFWGQTLINAGLNFVGGKLQDRATSKANEANQQAAKERIMQALAELNPQQIAALARAFMPEVMQTAGPLMQTNLQGLAVSQARQGLAGTPYGLTAEAGLRGYMANQASSEAFRMATALANQRASAITGIPIPQQQAQTGLANAFGQTANQGLLAYALSRRQPSGTPFMFGNPLRDPYGMQQYEGTPYRWPFNPGVY